VVLHLRRCQLGAGVRPRGIIRISGIEFLAPIKVAAEFV
jgi:hypothetical protein